MCISDGSPAGGLVEPEATAISNSFSAWPAMRGLGRYYELDVCCAGQADAQTGYFINIKQIDQAVREHLLCFLEQMVSGPDNPAGVAMGHLMQQMINLLQPPLEDSVQRLRLSLSPMHHIEIGRHNMDQVTIRQQYEFSAAHRLQVADLDEEENRRLFGKCFNPAGHGHNYRLEVVVDAPIDPAGHILWIDELDQTVTRQVIDKLDHKHLNEDVEAFGNLNPSVEHIAQVIWQMLSGHVTNLGSADAVKLAEISIWETQKTRCTYRGPTAD
jgi:6-pyruvoyltetrahydropterin/6-carboxytetrahydropterin synthase